MERSRVTVIALIYVLLLSQKRIYAAEMEMNVRPGDNITLYCDRPLTHGFSILWIRNCSHENQPSLMMDYRTVDQYTFKRFSFIYNPYNSSHDLHITNISVADLGLYYCAEEETQVHKNKDGFIYSVKVYYYGSRTTRLSIAVNSSSGPSTTISPSLVSDCILCWKLLFSVCPVCVLLSSLLSSTCVYSLCRTPTADYEQSAEIRTAKVLKVDPTDKHQCEMSKNGKFCLHTEVTYRLLTSTHPYAKM
ncbi:uncharacterized protein LOC127445294 [Myxocyprinus asiaticus]|uniref:uncharacterized protein LOC127445294 n=1 Tax=Myxocyprinus asiaticus TaxID=70543 RepID=UPI0022231AAD|nr:uncharacterized protein LOC127445294 [Myxocyprinus asiaticus]